MMLLVGTELGLGDVVKRETVVELTADVEGEGFAPRFGGGLETRKGYTVVHCFDEGIQFYRNCLEGRKKTGR
jgi:hypothetical protein